jgi:hypothetical protein
MGHRLPEYKIIIDEKCRCGKHEGSGRSRQDDEIQFAFD